MSIVSFGVDQRCILVTLSRQEWTCAFCHSTSWKHRTGKSHRNWRMWMQERHTIRTRCYLFKHSNTQKSAGDVLGVIFCPFINIQISFHLIFLKYYVYMFIYTHVYFSSLLCIWAIYLVLKAIIICKDLMTQQGDLKTSVSHDHLFEPVFWQKEKKKSFLFFLPPKSPKTWYLFYLLRPLHCKCNRFLGAYGALQTK